MYKRQLLKSAEAVNKQAMRILKLFGNCTTKKVNATAGAEQEYFLVDRKNYEDRLDLKICGRTLFGAKPPKGQEMDDPVSYTHLQGTETDTVLIPPQETENAPASFPPATAVLVWHGI